MKSNKERPTSPILAGLKGDERAIMERALKSSSPVFNRLVELLDKEFEKLEEDSIDFSNPSWAYRQAYVLGFKKGLTKFKKYVIINE